MSISLYKGISKNELNAFRTTSEGKTYTINHPNQLLVNMRFKGNDCSNVNSQGWERSSSYYFKELQNQHPEFFSRKNNIRIESGKSPIVDKKFSDYFPRYKEYKGETLVHHHIGQDGQAVALPQSIHKGYGEIHTVEHNLGITEKAQSFSNSCGELCKKNPSLYGQTSDRFKSLYSERKKLNKQSESLSLKSKVGSISSTNSIKGASHGTRKVAKNNRTSNTHGKSTSHSRE